MVLLLAERSIDECYYVSMEKYVAWDQNTCIKDVCQEYSRSLLLLTGKAKDGFDCWIKILWGNAISKFLIDRVFSVYLSLNPVYLSIMVTEAYRIIWHHFDSFCECPKKTQTRQHLTERHRFVTNILNYVFYYCKTKVMGNQEAHSATVMGC